MPSIVNAYQPTGSFGSALNFTITAVGSGNALVVVFEAPDDAQPVVSVENSEGGTNAQSHTLAGSDPGVGGSSDVFVYYRANITNGPTRVTINTTGNFFGEPFILEVSGLAASSVVDEVQTASGTSSTAVSTPYTTDSANQLAVGVVTLVNGDTITPQAGYSQLPASGSSFVHLLYDADVDAAGAKTVGGTLGSSNNWRQLAVSFRATGGGGGSTGRSRIIGGKLVRGTLIR